MRERWLFVLAIVAVAAAAFSAGLLFRAPAVERVEVAVPVPLPVEKEVHLAIPAVDAAGNGVVASLITRIKPGTGLWLITINEVVAGYETQLSARTAAQVAQNFTGLNLSGTDIIYQIKANATVVEGPSAGAALAVATIAALENRSLAEDVMITGTIEEGGQIGAVGAILQKAQAAKAAGARLFLVPKGQGTRITTYERTQTCRQFDSLTICQTFYTPKRVDISEELGIQIKEVENIQQALEWFLK